VTRFLRAVMNRRVSVDYLGLYNMNNTTLNARRTFMKKIIRRLKAI